MRSRDDDLLLVAEMTTRHLAEMIEEPPRFRAGLLKSSSAGVGQFLEDGAKVTVPVTNKVAAAGRRVYVQFNPTGSAFVVQAI
jgi:hypothetical protein